MMRARAAAVCLVAAVSSFQPASVFAQTPPAPAAPTMPWHAVDHIVTAAVIDVRGVGLVRLAGVEEGGELSRAFLAGLISSRVVSLIATGQSTGLTEALVYTPDGRCVNAELIRFGYARAKPAPGFDRAAEFRGLEEDARRLKRGLWGPSPPVAPPPPAAPSRRGDPAYRSFFIGAGGGATLGEPRDWIALVEIGVAFNRALALYVSAGHLHDLGDGSTVGAERGWQGSGGLRLTVPIGLPIRPYLKAGGGSMRIIPDGDSPSRDEPFWEAGAGLATARGPVHVDVGYTFARVGATEVARVAALLGIRF